MESGEYASSSEVIREALRDWKPKRALQQNELAELRRLWQTSLESGPGRLTDMDAIKAEATFVARRRGTLKAGHDARDPTDGTGRGRSD